MADKVRFGKGVTINTGNYEAVRLDLALEVDRYQNETADQAFNRAKKWVEETLATEEGIIRRGGKS